MLPSSAVDEPTVTTADRPAGFAADDRLPTSTPTDRRGMHAPEYPVTARSACVLGGVERCHDDRQPRDPAGRSCGRHCRSIHGGTKANIIPDEVKLQLTLRSTRTKCGNTRSRRSGAFVRAKRSPRIRQDRMPLVEFGRCRSPRTYNDPPHAAVRSAFTGWFGEDRVKSIDPEMGGEDFSQFGRTVEKFRLHFRVGAVAPEKIAESERTACRCLRCTRANSPGARAHDQNRRAPP